MGKVLKWLKQKRVRLQEHFDKQKPACDALPAVLPLDLCSMDTLLFSASLLQQKRRPKQRYSEEDIERIDEQFRNLRIAVKKESGLARILKEKQARSVVSSFEDSWSPLIAREYDDLRIFCGVIASVMPRTATVESDFSIINWTKDPSSQRLTDFSLEAILIASSSGGCGSCLKSKYFSRFR
jgi:hypothetical protein